MDKLTEIVKKARAALLGFRKWSFVMSLLAVTTILVAGGLIGGEDFATIWAAVGSAFMGSNMIEHVMDKFKETPTASRRKRRR